MRGVIEHASAEIGDAANSALETLLALHRHKAVCPQCRFDTSFCDTYHTYEKTWLKDFEVWEKLKRRG